VTENVGLVIKRIFLGLKGERRVVLFAENRNYFPSYNSEPVE
jgi:hypothetical protein